MTKLSFHTWWHYRNGLEIVVGMTCLLLLAGLLWMTYAVSKEDEQQWQTFSASHECRVTGKMSGSTSLGIGVDAKGQAVTTVINEPDKTGYTCNDGVTYWR